MKILHFYVQKNNTQEWCYNVLVDNELTKEEYNTLVHLVANAHDIEGVSRKSFLDITNGKGVEVGGRLNYISPDSSKTVEICYSVGLTQIIRVEKSVRYVNETAESINYDRTLQQIYSKPIEDFGDIEVATPVLVIDLIGKGINAFDDAEELPGLNLSEADKLHYLDYFVNKERRNPTDVELYDLLNSNSEHSRHGVFGAQLELNGIVQERTLFELVKQPIKTNTKGSVIAFHDNSSSISGYTVKGLVALTPGQVSNYKLEKDTWDLTCTVETHNHPTGISPFPGAATGTGGRIRDQMATGRGSNFISGTIGYYVASLKLNDHHIAGEDSNSKTPSNMATGLEVLIQGSNGATRYGNEFGEPLTVGVCRNFDNTFTTTSGSKIRWAYIKPILLAGGVGKMRHMHHQKLKAEDGFYIVQVGGPAYPIGQNGGFASSIHTGEQSIEFDQNSVQRGNPEMENRMYRAIATCNELGEKSPIASIHDQGAAGPGNVLKELAQEAGMGGKINIRKINIGAPGMSVLEIWVCEYQERCGFIIYPNQYELFASICERESAPCELLGEITSDGRFVVLDSDADEDEVTEPVNLDLQAILGDYPQQTYSDTSTDLMYPEFGLDGQDLPAPVLLQMIFSTLDVGSKEFLIHKGDRSVGGNVIRQQAVGPLGLPLANAAVNLISHFASSGQAVAIGENPIRMLINPAAGARMAIAEMVLNILSVRVKGLEYIKSSVNWMWAPRKSGELVTLDEAVKSASSFTLNTKGAIDGGKDSLSMATNVDGELIKSPRTVVVTGYVPVDDVKKIVTPDLKKTGSSLIYIDLSNDQARLGATQIAKCFHKLGDECSDVDPEILVSAGELILQLHDDDYLLSYHDVSDGGVITTVCEMAMAGNCGIDVNFLTTRSPIAKLFSEEPGVVIEVPTDDCEAVCNLIKNSGITYTQIGEVIENQKIQVSVNNISMLNESTHEVLSWWRSTSQRLEIEQGNMCALEEAKNTKNLSNPNYKVTFIPDEPCLDQRDRIPVAVVREQGSNGDVEMKTILYMAGFDPVDITMYDLLHNKADLNDYTGAVFVGGFSYGDTLGAAEGWAKKILHNPKLAEMFETFRGRSDTWSFGVCNGCQMLGLLGWTGLKDTKLDDTPVFTHNLSEKYEARYTTVLIPESKSIMFSGMEGSILPIWSAHGEGRVQADVNLLTTLKLNKLVPVLYADSNGVETMDYPFNPNGSPLAIAGLCSEDGRHTIMMPHPERLFRMEQYAWCNEELKQQTTSPWLQIFKNARQWCENS